MRILLDENIAWVILKFLESEGHRVDHVKSIGGGLKNGAVYRKAKEDYDLFITNDRDFLEPKAFAPTPTLGIIFMQIKMTHPERQVEALKNLFSGQAAENLKGRLTILREEDIS